MTTRLHITAREEKENKANKDTLEDREEQENLQNLNNYEDENEGDIKDIEEDIEDEEYLTEEFLEFTINIILVANSVRPGYFYQTLGFTDKKIDSMLMMMNMILFNSQIKPKLYTNEVYDYNTEEVTGYLISRKNLGTVDRNSP